MIPGPETSTTYELTVAGRLDPRWSGWFAGFTLTTTADGTTVLRGPITDQADLHGLLARIRDLGLPLISVRPADQGVTPCSD
jgi:hypothetical protein